MNPKRKRRLWMVLMIVLSSSVATVLVIYALKQNMNLYYNPAQVVSGVAPRGALIRLGGMVQPGSIQRSQKSLYVSFVLTDKIHAVKVDYTGLLPDLFREGQGIVTQGKLDAHGVFHAEQVLAKHSADYMPRGEKK